MHCWKRPTRQAQYRLQKLKLQAYLLISNPEIEKGLLLIELNPDSGTGIKSFQSHLLLGVMF